MKILLFGDTGQVGYELAKQFDRKKNLILISKTDVSDRMSVKSTIRNFKPDIIINSTAYTDVEKAEDDNLTAFSVNAYAVQAMAEGAAQYGSYLIHYSTDYVFSDQKDNSYFPSDKPDVPLNVYGKSKLLGEEFIREIGCNHTILRTSWVFSSRRKNFLKTMLKLASEHETLKVIDDQIGSPTSANEIARQTIKLLEKPAVGTFHLVCKEFCSWYEFTKEIIKQATALEFPIKTKEILPILTNEYPTKAKRPHNSKMDSELFEKTFETKILNWKEALKEVMEEIKLLNKY